MTQKYHAYSLYRICYFVVLPALVSCASQDITFKTDPAGAIVTTSDFDSPDKKTEIGKGEFKVSIDTLNGKIIYAEAKDREPTTVLPLNLSPSDVVAIRLKPRNMDLQKKLSDLEAKLEIEKRNAQSLAERLSKIQVDRHRSALLVARLQNSINQSALTRANVLAAELFQIPDNLLPAVAYTLRGKLRLLELKRNEARTDFTRALQISPQETEAKIFLENLK